MEILVVRHGFSVTNEASIWSETPPGPGLTPRGRKIARGTREKLAGVRFDAVFTSQFRRTQETARIIRPRARLHISPLLNERKVGMDGKPYEEAIPIYHASFSVVPVHGESFMQFKDRVLRFLDSLRRRGYRRVLVVSHGAVCQVFRGLRDSIPDAEVPRLKTEFGAVLKYTLR